VTRLWVEGVLALKCNQSSKQGHLVLCTVDVLVGNRL
jgi:hypothetical protein